MAEKTWQITMDGQPHTVRMIHSPVSRKCKISVDDWTVFEDKVADEGDNLELKYQGHDLEIVLQSKGLSYVYELLVDSVSVDTGERGKQKVMPAGHQGMIMIGVMLIVVAILLFIFQVISLEASSLGEIISNTWYILVPLLVGAGFILWPVYRNRKT
jgi:hypothetical protein